MKVNSVFICVLFVFLSCSSPEGRRSVSQKISTVIIPQAIQQNIKLNKLESKEIERYISLDSINDYKISTHGFWYYYNFEKKENSLTPKTGDIVNFTYDIKNLDGTTIYSKEELGVKSYQIDIEDFIPALQEGIKLMKVGETITFVIPSYRAFGLSGDGNKIKINQIIKSTITLLNIK